MLGWKMCRWCRCLFLTLWLSVGVQAQTGGASVVYVGVNDAEYRPFSWIDGQQLQGIDREILDAFARAEGVELVYLPLPRLRAIELLREGKIQLLYPDDHHWMVNAKEGLSLRYSEAAVHNQSGFFLQGECTEKASVTRIGTLLGWIPPMYQKEISSGAVELYHFATIEQLLDAGTQGKVDAIYAERQFAESYIARHHPRYLSFDFCDLLPSVIGDLRLSTLHHPELLERFNRFLFEQSALTQAITQRYRLP